jgi:hypothetical protein
MLSVPKPREVQGGPIPASKQQVDAPTALCCIPHLGEAEKLVKGAIQMFKVITDSPINIHQCYSR